jgi:hypothetical protein
MRKAKERKRNGGSESQRLSGAKDGNGGENINRLKAGVKNENNRKKMAKSEENNQYLGVKSIRRIGNRRQSSKKINEKRKWHGVMAVVSTLAAAANSVAVTIKHHWALRMFGVNARNISRYRRQRK